MKHRIAGIKLNRAVKPREALFKSLVRSLVINGKIETTISRAKAIRPIVDKLITKAKNKSLTNMRQIQAFLQSKALAKKLINDISVKFKNKSGFTKVTRIGIRRGDSVTMARIEWTEIKDKLKEKKIISRNKTNKQK